MWLRAPASSSAGKSNWPTSTAAFARRREAVPWVVLVRGSSGIGKTALVRRFVEGVRRRDADAVVLSGRCYEQETVPYKALDSLVDALSQHLQRLPQARRRRCCPATCSPSRASSPCCVGSRRWPWRAGASSRSPIRSSCGGGRSRALRELLGRLARSRSARAPHRRPAVGRRGQRGPAARAAAPARPAAAAARRVLPHRGGRPTARS